MKDLNEIGLNIEKSKELAENLNDLLANYSVFYQNIRAYHWNIRGDKFFELHNKFEELYNDLFEKIDEVAERVLTLGYKPIHKYNDYIEISEIKENNETTKDRVVIADIISAFRSLLKKQRKILAIAGDIDDEGTGALMSDYIREQEKLVWMFTAYQNK